MKNITAIIPTLNEEINIERAINSVSFANEILIVDSFSSDKTIEIAQSMGARIIQREYENCASQKNWAIPQAKHEWIILIDADEVIPPQLKNEILDILSKKVDESAFWIPRLNYYMGQKVRFSGWQNDAVIRLFKRDECVYESLKVHSEIKTKGKIGRLKQKIEHHAYKGFSSILKKIDRYSSYKAYDKMRTVKKITMFHLFIKPAFKFFKHYILHLGFLDGRVGFIISKLSAYDVFIRGIKMWRIEEGENFDN